MTRKIPLTLLVCAVLSACGTKNPETALRVRTADNTKSLLSKISASAARIEQAAQEQRMMDAALRMPNMTENQYRNFVLSQSYEPDDLKYEISMPRFNGPAEKIVLGVANGIGWHYSTEGNPPAVPEVISKQYQHQRAIDVLKDISYSVDTMDVVIDAPNKRIVVRYKGQ